MTLLTIQEALKIIGTVGAISLFVIVFSLLMCIAFFLWVITVDKSYVIDREDENNDDTERDINIDIRSCDNDYIL